MMSGHVKHKRYSLACKMQDSGCNTGDPGVGVKSMASGHQKNIKKRTRPVLILATWHHTTESVTICLPIMAMHYELLKNLDDGNISIAPSLF